MGTQGPKTGFKVQVAYPETVQSGTLWGWGLNTYGNIGDKTITNKSSPVQIGLLTNWSKISQGEYTTLAIKTDGTLWGWGSNFYGSLGNGPTTNFSSPVQIGSLTNWSKVTCLNSQALAIKTDGTLWSWGYNLYGQLGNGTVENYSSPIQIGSLTTWSDINSITGGSVSAAIKTDGTLWMWGYNVQGQLGNGTTINYSSPIQVGSLTNWSKVAAGAATLAIKTDGTLWGWGYNQRGQVGNGTQTHYSSPIQIGSLTNWSKVAVGFVTSAAIKTDGTLWTWGQDSYGQLGLGSTAIVRLAPSQVGILTNWKNVVCGYYQTIMSKTDGTLWACGYNGSGQLGNDTTKSYSSPIQIGSLTNWNEIGGYRSFFAIPSSTEYVNRQQDLGERYVSKDYLIDVYPEIASSTGARKTAGIWTWGSNAYGCLGNNTMVNYSSPIQLGSLTTWKQIGGNYAGYGAIKTDGTLWVWGCNNVGPVSFKGGNLGNGTSILGYSSPVQVGSLTNWKQVCISVWGSGAIKTDGTLWTWGDQGYGAALGLGNKDSYSSPVQVGSLTNWKFFDNTNATARALKTDGTLWVWGYNPNGQLGNGTIIDYSSPIQIGSLTNWKYVNAGWQHTLAIKTDGTLWGWGYDGYGQLGNGATVSYSSPIQVGSMSNWKEAVGGWVHSYGIKTDGTLWAWGGNAYGQLGLGNHPAVAVFGITNISSPMQVAGGATWSIATDNKLINAGESRSPWFIKNDGTLWAWGDNAYGQLGRNNTVSYSSPIQVGGLNNWKLTSCGFRFNGAVKTDGTLWTCGYNYYGQLCNGTTIDYSSPIQVGTDTNWKQISCGRHHTMMVKTNGTLWGCGYNYLGELGVGNTIKYSSPVQVGSLTNWSQVTSVDYSTYAIKTDGTLWAWGNGGYGNLGNSATARYSSPIQIGSLTNWKQIASAQTSHVLAVKTDGTLWTWGVNAYGQLGNGTQDNYSSPIQIGTLTNWSQVSAGPNMLTAVKTDGTIWACGYGRYGQIGNSASGATCMYSSPVQVGSLTNWNTIISGDLYTLAIDNTGTAYAWGYNGEGSLGAPSNYNGYVSSPVQVGSLTNWKSLPKGGTISPFSVAIKTDGTLWAWGHGGYGALGDGTTVNYSSPIQIGSLTSWKQIACGYYNMAGISDGYY